MACRKQELREERRNRNAAAASSVAMSDALLLTTMCIIGMPVDVYAKDGSVYSGIFHTASVDKDYAIVLKKATMTKKGNLDANIVNGTLIETLVVGSEDLVQVVAKGVQIPCNGISEYVWGDGLNNAEEVVKSNDLKWKKKHKGQSRQVGDGSQEMRSDSHNNPESQENRTVGEARGASLSITGCEAQSTAVLNIPEDTIQQEPRGVSFGSYSSLEDQDQGRPSSDEVVCRVASPPNVSVASIPILDFKSESRPSTPSNPILWVPPKSSSVKGTAKESKLNPGAKTFSPSMLRHRTVAPPVVPNGASVSYCTIAPEEIDASSYTRSSVPVKFVPYNNMVVGHGGNDVPYLQPIIGQVMNRTHPIRYTGQYQNFQTGSAYVHPNPQNIMFGRGGPRVCMHPISSDVQTAVGLSPATTRPLLTPHQVHLPKYQGNASAQALQLCMTPPVMANGPQPFVMTSSIPISQPVFPILRPIAIPGSNGFFSSKFA